MIRPHREMGDRIRKARRAADLTQQQVSDALNVSVQSVSQWETGRTRPDPDRLSRLSDLVGVAVGYLLQGSLTKEGKIPSAIKQSSWVGVGSRYAPIISSKEEAIAFISHMIDEKESELIFSITKPAGRLFSYVLTDKDAAPPEYREGDVFVIDDGVGFRNGDIVLALNSVEDTLDFRQVRGVRLDNNDRTIVDFRPLDGSAVISSMDLDDDENRILGTVVEHRRVRPR